MLVKSFISLIIVLLISLPVNSPAKIMDGIVCDTCHTMHASQDGTTMGTTTGSGALLRNNCSGCHTGLNNSTTVANGSAPYVLTNSGVSYAPTGTDTGNNTLAGGNFYWVSSGSDRSGHNVDGISSEDAFFQVGVNIPGGSTPLAAQLTCAGSNGCHGNSGETNEVKALMPAHHSDDSSIDGTSIAKSFRFLSGIIGAEDNEWEFAVSRTYHNQYKGGTSGSGSTDTDTITAFCKKCHGDFHSAGTDPWIRHPTDVNMPNSGEYAQYITYDPVAPVASVNGTPVVINVRSVANNAIVTCISCHRAHGTPYDAILRWDYKSWPGGGFNGCGICHDSKN